MKPSLALRTFLLGSVFLAASPLVNAAKIWDGGGADNSTLTANNWDNNVVPTSGPLFFAGTVQTTVKWDGMNSTSPVNLATITFSAGASAFTINNGTQTNIQFVTAGTALVNSSSNVQTFNTLSSVFFNGNKTFNGGPSGFAYNGGIEFRGDQMTTGQTNTLSLFGAGPSTVASIKRTGAFAGTATTDLRITGTGKITVTGNDTDTGTINITDSAGTLELQGSVAASSITNSGSLIFNNAAAQSYGNTISGSGTLTKTGAGKLTRSQS